MKADLTEAEFRDLKAAPILLADRWKRSFSQMARLEDISLNKAREHIMYTTYLDHSEVLGSLHRSRGCLCIWSPDTLFTSMPVQLLFTAFVSGAI